MQLRTTYSILPYWQEFRPILREYQPVVQDLPFNNRVIEMFQGGDKISQFKRVKSPEDSPSWQSSRSPFRNNYCSKIRFHVDIVYEWSYELEYERRTVKILVIRQNWTLPILTFVEQSIYTEIVYLANEGKTVAE